MQKKIESKHTASQRLAGCLQDRFERLSRRGKITSWFLFCLIACGASGWFIVDGITTKAGNIFTVTSIKIPAHTTGSGIATSTSISEQQYKRIHGFRMYMDSLARSPSGRPLYDSMVQRRPGLMDSIQAVERFYSAQQK